LNRQGRLILFLIIFSILSYYLFSRFVITAVVVQGRSMAPTLQDGGRYLLNRVTLCFREPRRGDVIVIRDLFHADFAVKRIVGLPGEAIQLREGRVFINGQTLEEPYLAPGTRTYSPDWRGLTIDLDVSQYFVLGDNRPSSEDSRSYGPLSRKHIVGLIVK
jgi:signal peptidase I